MVGNHIRICFLAVIVVVISTIPAYSVESPGQGDSGNQSDEVKVRQTTAAEAAKNLGDKIDKISADVTQQGKTLEQLNTDVASIKKQLGAVQPEVNTKAMSRQSLTTGVVAALAILIIIAIRLFEKQDVKDGLDRIEKNIAIFSESAKRAPGRPVITDMDPQEGSPSGGESIKISGSNFDDTTLVWIGEQRARLIKLERLESGWQILAEAPPLKDFKEAERLVDVKVETAWGSEERRKYFRYRWPDLKVEPGNLPIKGGECPVKGRGFGPATTVKVDNQDRPKTYVSSTWLIVDVLPGQADKKVVVEAFREDNKTSSADYLYV